MKKGLQIVVTIISLATIGAGIFSGIMCTKDFFTINIAQALTILAAVLVAFWATQRKTDERKVKEQIEKIVYRIQEAVSSTDFIVFDVADEPENVRNRITITVRKLKNLVDILQKYCKVVDITEETTYINDRLGEYNDIVSEKIFDLNYLSDSKQLLWMYAENISSRCDYIIVKLYIEM